MSEKRVGFLGGGNMAQAIIHGLLQARVVEASQIVGVDVDAARREALQKQYGIEVRQDAAQTVAECDCIVLAVKPQVVETVLVPLRDWFGPGKLLISVCAGVTLRRLAELVAPQTRLIRAMPNTPALIGAGATAVAASTAARADDLELARQWFECVGSCVVVDEPYMDAVTGLSGSGPAYVMLVIEALADGGVRAGLPRATALSLAAQTVMGAAKLVLETNEHPAVLKDRVTSPAGTTAAGLFALERAGLRHAMIDAVGCASARSRELGAASESSKKG